MKQLNYKDKIKMYEEYKNGMGYVQIAKKYNLSKTRVQYMLYLVDRHGYEVLKTKKNRDYPKDFKEDAISRVLINGESKWSVALDIGLPSFATLNEWILKYKENGYNIVERKRGRPTMPKVTKKKENETQEEKIKRLEEENLYLKAELEYSKKLRAVVQARKNRQQKKK